MSVQKTGETTHGTEGAISKRNPCAPMLTVLCGYPASGKSTYAATLTDCSVLSTDAINSGASVAEVFKRMQTSAAFMLSQGEHVVIDACSLTGRSRREWLDIAKRAKAETTLVIMRTPYRVCRKRDAARGLAAVAGDWEIRQADWKATMRNVHGEGWASILSVKQSGQSYEVSHEATRQNRTREINIGGFSSQ